MVETSMGLLDGYNSGKKYGKLTSEDAKALSRINLGAKLQKIDNPAKAFAVMAAFFAGQQEEVMSQKLKDYTTQYKTYKRCLDFSKNAHEGKAAAAAKGDKGASYSSKEFDLYMNEITGNKFNNKYDKSISCDAFMDKGCDGYHNKEEWQQYADVINQQKDMESTELNKVSNDMDMAVKDSSKAEEITASAVKKATELMATQGRISGG